MRKTEFDGVSREDVERFEELLTGFYGLSGDDSYRQFTKEIRDRLSRRDTNARYRSQFENNLDDLVMSVVSRFIRINSKLHADGQKIHNFRGMLEDRIGHVYFEELRRLARLVDEVDVNDMAVPSKTNSPDVEIELSETRAMKARCYKKCLGELPLHISNIFVEYYNTDGLSPTERTRARQQLALRVANSPPSETTHEEVTRAKRNLQSLICKWRTEHLKPCKEKCLKQRSSLH